MSWISFPRIGINVEAFAAFDIEERIFIGRSDSEHLKWSLNGVTITSGQWCQLEWFETQEDAQVRLDEIIHFGKRQCTIRAMPTDYFEQVITG